MQGENVFCIRLQGMKVGKKGETPRASDMTTIKNRGGRKSHLATGPDEDDGRDASGRLRIPVSVFYEMKMHICGIILVLDGPRDEVGRGQLGLVIDEGLDDCDFEGF